MSPDPPRRIYELADFESVLAAAQSQADAVLVGGQAVYFWATRYRPRCAELDGYLPYTSQDADYLAGIPAAQHLARTLHGHFQPAPQKGGMLGLTLGFITLPAGLRLEILGRINGVKEAVVRETAIRLEWRGKIVNVIHPLQLLIGKGSNLLHLDQSDRQDAKHFAIMQWVMRSFLAELSASRETLAPKVLLACCESLIRFALENTGLRLILAGHMPLPVFWPDLTEHPSSKVRNFVRLRAPRWQGQVESALEKRRARTRLPEP